MANISITLFVIYFSGPSRSKSTHIIKSDLYDHLQILKLEAQYAERVRTIEAKHLEVEELLRQTAKERDVFKENEDRLDKMYRQLEGQLRQVYERNKIARACVYMKTSACRVNILAMNLIFQVVVRCSSEMCDIFI